MLGIDVALGFGLALLEAGVLLLAAGSTLMELVVVVLGDIAVMLCDVVELLLLLALLGRVSFWKLRQVKLPFMLPP